MQMHITSNLKWGEPGSKTTNVHIEYVALTLQMNVRTRTVLCMSG